MREQERKLGGGKAPGLVEEHGPSGVAEHHRTDQWIRGVDQDVGIRVELPVDGAAEGLHLLEQGARRRRDPEGPGPEEGLGMGQ
jgi:hypothetical protein